MVNLVHRSRSKNELSLLPISAPASSDASPLRYYGLVVAFLLLLAGGACAAVASTRAPGGAASPVEGEVAMSLHSPNSPNESVLQPTLLEPATAAATEVITSPPPAKPCKDSNGRCPQWAREGECARNEGFMHRECAASCGTCGQQLATPQPRKASAPAGAEPPKRDARAAADPHNVVLNKQEVRCYAWAAQGECEKNPTYMRDKCKDACSHSASTRDKEEA